MRIAFISDVHGNYPALLNVVEDAVSNGVDKMVFIGDYIFDLPFSNEVAHLLMEQKNAYIIRGNKEAYLERLSNENQSQWVFNQMAAVYQTYRELSADAYRFLTDLHDDCRIQISPDVSIYAVHVPHFIMGAPKTACNSSSFFRKKMLAEPFSHEQYLSEFNNFVNLDENKNLIDQIDSDILVFGHNHLQAYAYCGNKLIINAGSCGQPLDFNTSAAYTIIEVTSNGYNVHERRVQYDIAHTIDCARKSLLYQKAKIWCNLVFLALETGKDYFGVFFEIARSIAQSKNENGPFFSNSTWAEAQMVFEEQCSRIF